MWFTASWLETHKLKVRGMPESPLVPLVLRGVRRSMEKRIFPCRKPLHSQVNNIQSWQVPCCPRPKAATVFAARLLVLLMSSWFCHHLMTSHRVCRSRKVRAMCIICVLSFCLPVPHTISRQPWDALLKSRTFYWPMNTY